MTFMTTNESACLVHRTKLKETQRISFAESTIGDDYRLLLSAALVAKPRHSTSIFSSYRLRSSLRHSLLEPICLRLSSQNLILMDLQFTPWARRGDFATWWPITREPTTHAPANNIMQSSRDSDPMNYENGCGKFFRYHSSILETTVSMFNAYTRLDEFSIHHKLRTLANRSLHVPS